MILIFSHVTKPLQPVQRYEQNVILASSGFYDVWRNLYLDYGIYGIGDNSDKLWLTSDDLAVS